MLFHIIIRVYVIQNREGIDGIYIKYTYELETCVYTHAQGVIMPFSHGF